MANRKFTRSTIELSNGEGFEIMHNIPEGDINGLQGAIDNWLVRTDEYTPESFCKYVNSKGLHKAYTVEQFQSLIINR